MKKELILSGFINSQPLTNDELKEQVYEKILSRLHRVWGDVEIYLGNKLYRDLYNAHVIAHDTSTINRVCVCSVSYDIPSFSYFVYEKYDREDSITMHVDISWQIKKIIFNPPATIIFWKDGSKTVVKCNGEAFDPEKGMAMAISRKVLGDSYDYYNIFEKWRKKYKEPKSMPTPQEVAAKYMTPPIVSELDEQLRMAVEEVKRYTKIESGDSDAD